MRIKLIKPLGPHAAGSQHDVSNAVAKRLIDKGAAEKITSRQTSFRPAKKKDKSEPVVTPEPTFDHVPDR